MSNSIDVDDVLFRDGFHLKDIAIWKQRQRLDPDDLPKRSMLADLYVREGNANKASEVRVTIAERLIERSRLAEALQVIKIGLSSDPDNGKLRAAQDRLCLIQKNSVKADA